MRGRPVASWELVGGGLAVLLSAVATAVTGWAGPAAVVAALACACSLLRDQSRARAAASAAAASWGVAAWIAWQRGTEAGPLLQGLVGVAVAAAVGERLAARAWSADEEAERAQARAEVMSVRDELTGLPNVAGVAMVGRVTLEQARRRSDAAHALVVDVDGTSVVNAELGRGGGDEVLLAVAEALQAVVRGTDVVGRYDGDAFVVVGPGVGMPPLELERRVRAQLVDKPPVPLRAWDCRVTAGRGVLEPWDAGDVDELVARAEADLHLRRAMRMPSVPEPERPWVPEVPPS